MFEVQIAQNHAKFLDGKIGFKNQSKCKSLMRRSQVSEGVSITLCQWLILNLS